ncbi:MAG TPA: hypothetical protein VHP63_07845 [candidate division Zixibacteria bacterium]|nr:hypothetical protein [candidate division Zixibacteria bacterium]
MADSPVGFIFWIIAIVSITAAILAVTLRKAVWSILALAVSLLAVAGVFIYLEFVSLAIFYLLIIGGALLAIYFPFIQKQNSSGEAARFESHPKNGKYIFTAFMVFVGSLYLIAHTEVWQYASEARSISFSKVLETIKSGFEAPFLFTITFLCLLLLIITAGRKPKDA